MTGAILNFYGFIENGKYNVHYDIGGTFFFITPNTALTANHLISKSFFDLNDFVNKQVFFIGENNFIVEVEKEFITDHKNVDLSIIRFPKNLTNNFYEIYKGEPEINQEFIAEGFIAGEQPEIVAKNNKLKIILEKVDFNSLTQIKQRGFVKKLYNSTEICDDMALYNVNTIQTSIGGFVGMSGGPLIDLVNKKVLGFMSYGDPVDSDKKDILYAIDCTELNKIIK